MTRNQLPEGVGKKIVEALKRQAEADITPVEDTAVSAGNELPLTEIENLPEIQYDNLNAVNDDVIIEEETPVMTAGVCKPKDANESKLDLTMEKLVAGAVNQSAVSQPAAKSVSQQINQSLFTKPAMNEETLKKAILQSVSQVAIPANVATLRNLINSLPVGVTKQTGALIIRQTLDAMGIPMNNVLKEAQVFQEELNSSTRECMMKIQEYKTQILQLESSVQEYQQNINQVNDIVSLFLLTDK